MKHLTPKFVEFIPKEPEDGIIYISLRFNTAVHKCACGCGLKTVTKISQDDWKLMYDGKTVSFYPSIANWQYPCQSHYWIYKNKVLWIDQFSDFKKYRKIRKRNFIIDLVNKKSKF